MCASDPTPSAAPEPLEQAPPYAEREGRPERPSVPPVLVDTRLADVVTAGIGVLLQPYGDRVALVGAHERDHAHVELFDPSGSAGTARPAVPRVALTWNLEPAAVERAVALGAVRVLPLSLSAAELVIACEQAHQLTVPGPDGLDAHLLSPREVDVVRGICRGLSNADIADELCLSVNSVKTYIRTAYRKMGVTSRSQALLWGLQRGY